MKRLLISLSILFLGIVNMGANVELNSFVVDASRNAEIHNNRGLDCLKERYYFGAIKEFEMAIQLNPNTQATAVYYSNLAGVYNTIGYPNRARQCYERALIQCPINFDYYVGLAQTYKKLHLLDAKLREYKSKKNNPLNQIMVGILYIEKGQVATGITVLDNFCFDEPDLIITKAVRNYINQKSPRKQY